MKAIVSFFIATAMLSAVPAASAQKKPGMNVQRQRPGTPEVTSTEPEAVNAGEKADVVLSVANFDTSNMKLNAYGLCKAVSQPVVVGPKKIQFTVEVAPSKSPARCDGNVQGGGKYAQWHLTVNPSGGASTGAAASGAKSMPVSNKPSNPITKPMSNADVIKMMQAGLPEDTIINAISINGGSFDTSADGLIALSKAKVSGKVIQAMIAAKKS